MIFVTLSIPDFWLGFVLGLLFGAILMLVWGFRTYKKENQ